MDKIETYCDHPEAASNQVCFEKPHHLFVSVLEPTSSCHRPRFDLTQASSADLPARGLRGAFGASPIGFVAV